MDICRICLTCDAPKNIFDSQAFKRRKKSLMEIFSFCLGIEVTRDSKVSTNLCLKCYKKVLTYNKFKILAQKSDTYLKSLVSLKHEVFIDEDAKSEEAFNNNDIEKDEFANELAINMYSVPISRKVSGPIKIEIEEVSLGCSSPQFTPHEVRHTNDSDDSELLLSVIKKMKYESVNENLQQDQAKPVQKIKRKKKKGAKKVEMCEECGKEVRNLKNHMLQHQSPDERKQYKCNVCEKVFSNYSSRQKHHKVKHLGLKKHCDICNKGVVSMRYHILMHHKPEAMKYECALCERKFVTKSLYEEHMTLHTKEKAFECPECKKRFRLRSLLSSHRRQVHQKEKSHLCQFCSKSFFKKYHLKMHIRSHTKEKPHECPECGKFYSSTTVLKNHLLIHKCEMKHQCPHCDSKFVRLSYLRSHVRTHSTDRPFSCQYCDVKFRRSDHRRRHEYTAHQKHMPLPPPPPKKKTDE